MCYNYSLYLLQVLYFGDSLRSDIFPPRKFAGWDTVYILEELACTTENCFISPAINAIHPPASAIHPAAISAEDDKLNASGSRNGDVSGEKRKSISGTDLSDNHGPIRKKAKTMVCFKFINLFAC